MKKSFLFLSFLFTMFFASAQDIADVEERGGTIITRRSDGSEISRMGLMSGEVLSGFSSYFVVVTMPGGRTVKTLNQNFGEISRMELKEGQFVKSVSGNNINVKYSDGHTVVTYDKNFNEKSRRTE
jgi:hypothetical protein